MQFEMKYCHLWLLFLEAKIYWIQNSLKLDDLIRIRIRVN